LGSGMMLSLTVYRRNECIMDRFYMRVDQGRNIREPREPGVAVAWCLTERNNESKIVYLCELFIDTNYFYSKSLM
jgi:hypothetical protein